MPPDAASLATTIESAPAKDRIEGMLLGVAIGDSLGNTSESMFPAKRHALYGEIRDNQINRYAHEAPFIFPSDDTQMTFWALRSILAEDGVVPESIAQAFSREHIYGIGSAVRAFLGAYNAGMPWYKADPEYHALECHRHRSRAIMQGHEKEWTFPLPEQRPLQVAQRAAAA